MVKYYSHYMFLEIGHRSRECTMIIFNSEANLLNSDLAGSLICIPILRIEGNFRTDKDLFY
jgi:hypothetical protein